VKILFLATWFPHPLDNGSKIRVCYLLRGLAAAGHDVTLLSFAFDTADVAGAHALRALCAEVRAIERNPFQRTERENRLRFLSFSPIVSRPILEMEEAVRESLSKHRVDLVIASTGIMAVYARLAPKGTAKILEEHNSMSRWAWDRLQAQETPLGRLRCWVSWNKSRIHESRLFRRFDLCTMVSEQDRQYSLQALPGYTGLMAVVPNGVDCEQNRPDLAVCGSASLVFNGALTYDANFDAMRWFLAEIYPLIRRQAPEVSLTITGSAKGVDLTGLTLDDTVHLTGFVDDVRIPVAEAAACVVPIRQGGGTRLKVLEAMALGTPVVATSKAVEGHGFVPDEHLLVADTAESFSQQTVRLLQNPELRSQLVKNGRQFVEARYDWRKIGRLFVDLCEEAVARKASR
jgi:polysaccharide biosynthesis protein PslH